MKQPKLEKACSIRGAQMGRADTLPPQEHRMDFAILDLGPLEMVDDGCYDKGGAYWGCGTPESGGTWCAWGEMAGYPVRIFMRARGLSEAAEKIRAALPNVAFVTE